MTHVNIPTRLVLAKDQRCPDLSHLKKKCCTLCQRSKVFSTVVTWLFFPATRMFQRAAPSSACVVDAPPPSRCLPGPQHRGSARQLLTLLRVPDALSGRAWFKRDTLIFYEPCHTTALQLPR